MAALTINAQATPEGDALIAFVGSEEARANAANFVRLSSAHYKLAEQCGRVNAAMIEQMPELYPNPKKGAREMAKMQASMFGLTTKDEIEQFIEAAEDAALEHLEILKEIE